MPENARYLIAADTGGTFTDLAVYDSVSGKTMFGKTLTTYDDLVVGAVHGLTETGASLDEARIFTHGTTHVINSLISRQGGRTALVTTRGFRDVLEIGRGNRSETFDLRYRRESPLIPRDLRLEVAERMDGQGRVVQPLDASDVERVAKVLRDAQVDSVAISFLNSYRNPLHELQAQQMLRELLPGVFVTIGTELSRELMEYERTATVAANAFVGSRMASYIAAFQQELDARSFHGRFYLMGSNGGAMSADAALANPVALIESGPVGGCAGAAVYASEMSIDRMIAFDMGGTTAKCALIESGTFEVVNTYYVNGYERGFPIRTPVLDIVEVGAGGGSLAWLDEHGRMRLGPRSAGSEPGPIAFGRGGVEPTLTDANVVLGRIGSDSFMDGALRLDIDAASEGIRLSLAEPLGFVGEDGVDRVAQGALDLACVAMSNAIKAITIERGRDVRGYTLFAFGGGGPIFATEIARSLGIGKVVVPPHPGMFSSFGMLLAPLRRDVAKAFMQPMNQDSLIAAEAQFAELEREVRESMSADVDVASIVCRREADISYMGQSHSVKVRLPAALTLESCSEAFEEAYRARYGHLNKDSRLHISVLRVVCEAELLKPDLRTLAAPRSGTEPGYGSDASDRHEDGAGAISPAQSREVYFAALRGRVRTPVYRRRDLSCGWHIEGPAIIEEYSSTTILGPGDLLEVGVLGELTIHCGTLPTGGRAAEGLSAAEACLGRHGSSENRA